MTTVSGQSHRFFQSLLLIGQFSSVQPLSLVRLSATPWAAAQPGLPVRHQLPKFTQTHVHRVADSDLILCRPLLLPPSIFPSLRVFSNESVHRIRWPKCWSFSFSISPSNEHPGLISFRIGHHACCSIPTQTAKHVVCVASCLLVINSCDILQKCVSKRIGNSYPKRGTWAAHGGSAAQKCRVIRLKVQSELKINRMIF